MAYDKVPVADRFVHATHDNWGDRRGPAKGFVIHMAEGFNVWSYLSGNNVARNVSVHFTIEADGEIVQMMELRRISGSINPTTLRTDDDGNGHYGFSHAKYALQSWWSNPNNAVITVEVAGKSIDGPNRVQVESIKKLFDYLRKRYPGIIPLGHRDFQNVKRCPGEKMWYRAYKEIGGHGKDYDPDRTTERGDDMIVVSGVVRSSSHTVVLKEGTKIFESTTDEVPIFTTGTERTVEYYGKVYGKASWHAVELSIPGKYFDDGKARLSIAYVKGTYTPVKKPDSPGSQDEIDALRQALAASQQAYESLSSPIADLNVAYEAGKPV